MARKLFIAITFLGVIIMCFGLGKVYKSKVVEAMKVMEAKVMLMDEKTEEEFMEELTEGKLIGTIDLPKINKELPIYEGTEEYELSKGVGHFTRTAFPGQNKQILLSGHRDTVFTGLGELGEGDEVIVNLPYGKFVYEIKKTKITYAKDPTIIDLNLDKEELIISTCYPFNYIGPAPDRYIIYAYPKGELEE